MIETILHSLTTFALDTINGWGYFGVFFLMMLESVNIPIPSEVIMPFAGYLAAQGKFYFGVVVVVGALGNLAGSLLNYWIAYRFGTKALDAFTRWHLLKQEDVTLAQGWFDRWGLATAFYTRLLPVVRTFISFPMGLAKVNVVYFGLFTVWGSLLWSWFLTYMGVLLGENWFSMEPYFKKGNYVIVGVIMVVVAVWIMHRIKKARLLGEKNSI
jgi:membrane protein DedA with SNARE-associated domain